MPSPAVPELAPQLAPVSTRPAPPSSELPASEPTPMWNEVRSRGIFSNPWPVLALVLLALIIIGWLLSR